jgi:hypothetical protein
VRKRRDLVDLLDPLHVSVFEERENVKLEVFFSKVGFDFTMRSETETWSHVIVALSDGATDKQRETEARSCEVNERVLGSLTGGVSLKAIPQNLFP